MKLLLYYLRRPLGLIGIGFVLVLTGVVLPFLIVLGVLPSTFLLNFLAYAASLAGLLLGIIGSAQYVSVRRRDE